MGKHGGSRVGVLTMAKERRLIDKDALKEGYIAWFYGGRYIPERCVETAPEIDAVEVVRCGQCMHWDDPYCTLATLKAGADFWSQAMIYRSPYDFCSYGKRKSDTQPQREDV